MQYKDKIILACITASILVGFVYWIQQETIKCPSNVPIVLTGDSEVVWGDMDNPYFSATITATDGKCSVDEDVLPSLVMTINVQGAGHSLDPVRLQAIERLSFDIIIKALDKEGFTLAEELVTKTLYTEDISTEVTDVIWAQNIEIEAREAQRFDLISVNWRF